MAKKWMRRGNVVLPFWGFPLFLPWMLFGLELLRYLARPGHPRPGFLAIAGSMCCIGIPVLLLLGFCLISLGICVEVIEWRGIQAGLGWCHIWKGSTLREKILRELTRVGIFLLGAGLAWIGIGWLPADIGVRALGFCAFWQLGILLLFYLIVLPLKLHFPALAFRGEPEQGFVHYW